MQLRDTVWNPRADVRVRPQVVVHKPVSLERASPELARPVPIPERRVPEPAGRYRTVLNSPSNGQVGGGPYSGRQ
jgi:hypothetical protein